jgi:hypothetical protein
VRRHLFVCAVTVVQLRIDSMSRLTADEAEYKKCKLEYDNLTKRLASIQGKQESALESYQKNKVR